MIHLEPWVDAEEWPEPASDKQRERGRDVIEFLEHVGPIKRAEPAVAWIKPSLLKIRGMRMAMAKRLLAAAAELNMRN